MRSLFKLGGTLTTLLLLAAAAFFYFFIYVPVPEGWNAVFYRYGEAKYARGPGASFKNPFLDSYVWVDMREQSNPEVMEVSSFDNMPLKATLSQTWQVTDALTFVKRFTTREYFESTILDRRFREVAKDVIPQYTATNLMRDRSKASDKIDVRMKAELEGYPAVIKSSQIEDVDPPKEFREAVLKVEQALKLVEEEKHKTEAQKQIAQRDYNTREAEARGIEVVAKANANAKRWNGEAEAAAAAQVGEQLGKNPALVQYEYAKRWNGGMPSMVPPSSAPMLLQIPAPSPPTTTASK